MVTMSSEDESPAETTPGTRPGAGGNPEELESLACVACRSRKLKCGRTKPACARCIKLKVECSYPESRRKPAFKRRNVRELEERLAQVEVLLNNAAEKTERPAPEAKPQRASTGQGVPTAFENGLELPEPDLNSNAPVGTVYPSLRGNSGDDALNWNYAAGGNNGSPPIPFEVPDMRYQPRADNAGATSYELLGLGLFEALPPSEMIEEMHQIYFTKQHPLIPILHPGRYIQSFYSAPHLRPIMALQYAVWTMATLGHEKYSQYHDAFHRRSRHYLEEDELKGDGEHFLTVAHAQAWALLATAEARNMWFTRATMSAARCIKLLHMMGLHRLDDPNAEFEMMPTILPPKDWVELEERRRVFWGAFAIDSHGSISTGWPTLIDANEVTTHLPSSEEAFNQGVEEKTCRLHDVFTGSTYSAFAAAAVICHVFNRIMKHANRSQPDDCPDDFEYGKFWNRHRELDNLLSGAFMFLPEKFRLPQNVRDVVAVHTNLNFHAATICLHSSAYEIANEHNLPEYLRSMTRTRVLSASNEVVNIVKLTSHARPGLRSPLVALALYVASSAYISQAQEDGLTPTYIANIELLLTAMEAIGKQHHITLNLLRQSIFELQEAGLDNAIRMPKLPPQEPLTGTGAAPCSQVPLFARSRISKRTMGILPPLPGRLPLTKPLGRRIPLEVIRGPLGTDEQDSMSANKRRRVNQPSSVRLQSSTSSWSQYSPPEELSSSDDTPSVSSRPTTTKVGGILAPVNLPHRGGSSTSASSPAGALNSGTTSTSSGTSPRYGEVENSNAFGTTMYTTGVSSTVNMDMFQGLHGWDASQIGAQDSSAAFSDVAAAMLHDDSWMMINEVGINGQPWDTGTASGGGAGVG